jgi:hypothetical protein
MTMAFWYWAAFFVWMFYALVYGYRNRVWFGAFYWGWNGTILLFTILFLIIGLFLFPDPFGTLVKR